MKKKIIVLAISCFVLASSVGCGKKNDSVTDDVILSSTIGLTSEMTGEITTEKIGADDVIITEEVNTTGQISVDMDEVNIRELIDANLVFMQDVLGIRMLKNSSWIPDQDGYIIPADENAFASYEAFEKFVRAVYVEEKANMFLYKYPTEDNPLFINENGKLYYNMTAYGEKGYYVDWTNYEITIDKKKEDRIEFTVTASIEVPADQPVKKPYDIKGAIVKQGDRWLLEDSVY